jgi:hypothetical protein
MDKDVTRTTAIQREFDRAEAELAIIKQEHLLQNLVTTGEPTAEAVEQLARLRDILKRLNIDGFDRGNGAALINHSRRYANCSVLREGRKVWIIAGIEGSGRGADLRLRQRLLTAVKTPQIARLKAETAVVPPVAEL